MTKVLLNKVKSGFKEKVLRVVAKIPKGKVLTYQQVAQLAGRPKASRAVGNILNKNYDPKIPCHRVIRSDGKVGGYNRGEKAKMVKLMEEGIKCKNQKSKIKILVSR